jgi:hypothetical protein
MHNVIALGEIIDLQKATINQSPLHCSKKLIGKRKHADHHHFLLQLFTTSKN